MVAAARWEGEDLILRVQVQPRARHEGFAGRHGETWRLRLAAPPIEGRANTALVDFLAEAFGVPKSRVTLIQGAGHRSKVVRISAPTCLPTDLDIPPPPANFKS